MPRLSKIQIREILIAADQGEDFGVIARRFGCDPGTVEHHVEAFERLYGALSYIHRLVPEKKRECQHPSLRCLVCGMTVDHIRRRELEEIAQLKARIARYEIILTREGYDVESGTL
jgi:hypothetical protein